MHEALERAMERLAFGPAIDTGDPEAVRTWLSQCGVSPADIDAIVQAGAERLAVYRTLLRTNLRRALQRALPRTSAALGSVLDESFDLFLHEHGPRTHYLRDFAGELVRHCAPAWRVDPRVAPWVPDLAQHELARHELEALPAGDHEQEAGHPLELDRAVRFIAAVRLLRYEWTVHELDVGGDPPADPVAEPVVLLVHRDQEHCVRGLQLTAAAGEIVDGLLQGHTLRDALVAACVRQQIELAHAIDGSAELLADLATRGILLGAA